VKLSLKKSIKQRLVVVLTGTDNFYVVDCVCKSGERVVSLDIRANLDYLFFGGRFSMRKLSILAMCLCGVITVTACQSNYNENSVESNEQPSASVGELSTSSSSKVESNLSVSSEQTVPSESKESESSVSEDLSKQETPRSNNTVGSQESAPHTNPFTLDPAGGYDLYAYNGLLLSYVQINPSWLPSSEVGPEFKAAVAAINNLPTLEKVDAVSAQNAQYGLMSIAQDYSKVQFFLYEDFLSVNDAAYAITNEQYETLKAAMSAGTANGVATPQWFVYMNPNRVTKIQCKDEQGKMTEIRKENVPFSAVALRTIDVKSVKTYTPGSKNHDDSPFKAVYTFDNGVTYTVYVSDDTSRTSNVVFYVESSDMNYACEYVSNTYISNYTEYTREAIDGPVNPWTM